ncbi:hypothetical protein KSP40_PGU013303 [Platanthera guangdongensis]|uniref:Late embryogenesis abundant protein LEA-2 subgroup domain-containing protein n=1 Tax=Platanthera guangdongensis TaxID=2320717 RepID=A0ABR2MI87_9ASPA
MSIIYDTSPKHCAAAIHGGGGALHRLKKLDKKLLFSLSTFFFSLLIISLLIWLIFHPSKPLFYLRDATLYDLSLTSPPLARRLNSTIQATIFSKNPNTRVGVYYDRLVSYAVYKGQQITADSELPPFYQGHEDSNFLSASLSGVSVPVAPAVLYEVGRDQMAGKMLIRLRLDGKLRWKVGSWVSGWYRFDVDCAAVVDFGVGGAGGGMRAPESVEGRQCSINA